MISIIVPVYNVAPYLDACLASITAQTFADIEIILINDGSTDGSGEICRRWLEKDARIVYIEKENEGLGPTRNLGVRRSTRDLILFVDSDDWIDPAMVEKLYAGFSEAGVDMSFCDRYNYTREDELYRVEQDIPHGGVVDVAAVPSVVFGTYIQSWAKLFRKSVLEDNGITQATGYYEDGTTPVSIALCRKIYYVREALYYYRFRDDAISDNPEALPALRNHFSVFRDTFRRHGLFETYKTEMERFFRVKIRNNLASIVTLFERRTSRERSRGEALFRSIRNELLEIYEEMFGSGASGSISGSELRYCVAFGSYNLQRAAMKYTGTTFSGGVESFRQSSIASVMSPYASRLNSVEMLGGKKTDRDCVAKDLSRAFAHKNRNEIANADCLLVDLLEERFALGESEGCLFTLSDSFADVFRKEEFPYRRLNRNESETERRWREHCLAFIDYCNELYSHVPLVLVRTMLAESYGLTGKEETFGNIGEIRETNAFLASCYDFFEKNCSRCRVVRLEPSELLYTYKDCVMGCVPWHLNNRMYEMMAELIMNSVSFQEIFVPNHGKGMHGK